MSYSAGPRIRVTKKLAGEVLVMSNDAGKTLTMQEIKAPIKGFILDEFLPGEDPAELTDSTPLLTGGILDSIATIRLVFFLEKQFQVKIHSHETMSDYLDTIEDIAQLIRSKL